MRTIADQLKAQGLTSDKKSGPATPAGTATAQTAAGFVLPTLGKLNLPSLKKAREGRDIVNNRILEMGAWLGDYIPSVVELLGAESDEYRLATNGIKEFRNILVQQVKAMPTEQDREALGVVIMDAILPNFPGNSRALNLATDIGFEIGYLVPATDEDVQRRKAVILPLSDATGKWKKTALISHGKDAHRILGLLRELKAKSDKLSAEQRRKEEGCLKQGATDIFAALEAGQGEAVLWTPDEKRSNRIFPGGTVRIHLENNRLFAVDAVGGCSRIVKLIAESKIAIPVESLKSERLTLRTRMPEEQFRLAMAWHSILRRGFMHEKEKAAAQEERNQISAGATPNLAPADLILHKKDGAVLIFFKQGWTVGTGKTAKLYPKVYFLLERNGEQLRVAACPKNLEELFAKCREFADSGENFSGLQYPLNCMTRTLYSIFKKNEQRNQADRVTDELALQFLQPEAPADPEVEPETNETPLTETEESNA